MREDDERQGASRRQRGGVTHRPAAQRHGNGRIAGDRPVVARLALTGGQRRRIPDLEREGAVVTCRRSAWRGAQDIGPVRVDGLQGADADRMWPERGELRRRRRDDINPIALCDERSDRQA